MGRVTGASDLVTLELTLVHETEKCVQRRDNEPYASGRSCPYPHWREPSEDDYD